MSRTEQVEMLSAMGWDLRALGEAQVRSLTSMQRCIEDYRKTADPDALTKIRQHINDLEHRSQQAKISFAHLLAAVAEMEAARR